mmetsp:Transcript_23401/g.35167  ORF Transcript_23401/g.35167 Transcript_23401/m.35167 type:complete len:521 (+) Transcript_23401:62-1624(+)
MAGRSLMAFLLVLASVSKGLALLKPQHVRCLSRTPRHVQNRVRGVQLFVAAKEALGGIAAPEYPNFSFKIKYQDKSDSKARTTTISTPHGEIQTPAFIFCATKAAIKGGIDPPKLRQADTQIILSNTYHLMLQPGGELVRKMGGLQKFSGWNGPMLTDSGGYQIFSMGHGSVSQEIKGNRGQKSSKKKNNNKNSNDKEKGDRWVPTLLEVNENGARFRSYLDGSIWELTPEKSIQIQRDLGADLIVVLDECTAYHIGKDGTAESMRMSHRWALRSLAEFIRGDDGSQALYGIIQGGVYDDLRVESAEFINSQPFFGTAIGGSLGDSSRTMHDIVKFTAGLVREDRPIHLLGIGGIKDVFNGVSEGIDTFDCVHPTRLGRHGGALVAAAWWRADHAPRPTPQQIIKNNGFPEHVNVVRAHFKEDPRPLDPDCSCPTCQNYSRAYLNHCLKAGESLGGLLISQHNVHFMNKMMERIRESIPQGKLDEVKESYVGKALEIQEMIETAKQRVVDDRKREKIEVA